MADISQFQTLTSLITRPDGRILWIEYRSQHEWIDMSTADFTDHVLKDFDLSYVNLSTAIFLGADLSGCDLSGATLRFSDMRYCQMRNTILAHADLSWANLQEAVLMDASMESANLSNARMSGCNLVGADLSGADLRDADFRGASLKYANLAGTSIRNANIAQAHLTGAILDESAGDEFQGYDEAVFAPRKYKAMRNRLARFKPPVMQVNEEIKGALDLPGPTWMDDDVRVSSRKAMLLQSERILASQRVYSRSERRDKQDRRRQNDGRSLGDRRNVRNRRCETVDETSGAKFAASAQIQILDLNRHDHCCLILEISTDAGKEEITKAFRRKAKLYHPDMVQHLSPKLQELAADEFRRLHAAYENLTHHGTRSLQGIHWPSDIPVRPSPYDYSVEEYEKMMLINPNNTDILYNLAWKYFEEGRLEQARTSLYELLAIDLEDDDADHNLTVVNMFITLDLPSPNLLGQNARNLQNPVTRNQIPGQP
jgi:uncharacterized protein YjbI with pentapeptide repeats